MQYLPGQAGADGSGAPVVRGDRGARARRRAAPTRGSPTTRRSFAWHGDVPAAFVEPERPDRGDDARRDGRARPRAARSRRARRGSTRATFTRAGTPAICFGPGAIAQAHAVDEYVPLDELTRAAQVLAVAAIRFCGVAED